MDTANSYAARVSQASNSRDFLAGGGEMGALMRSKDWSKTPLGNPETWPQTLKTQINICLNSRFGILLWWGPELVMLYNDKYREILGDKHPAAMGQRGAECWPEIWGTIGPMLHNVLERGEANWADDLCLPLKRKGYREECFFTFSYSPIRDESGTVVGIFTPVQETTEKVIGERRLRTLGELAARGSKAKSLEETCRVAADTLALNPRDLPFAAIYLFSEDGKKARLVCAAGMDSGYPACPPMLSFEGELSALERAAFSRTLQTLPASEWRTLSTGAWLSPPDTLIVVPIPGQSGPGGFLFTGVNPEKKLDAEYRTFYELVSAQIGNALAEAGAYEAERKRVEELAELDRAKTAFFSNVSHEFRTPLTLLLSPLEEILKDFPDLPVRAAESLQIAHRNGLRLQKLVNSLLDFSRIEAGRAQAVREPVDLAEVTAGIASNFRSAMEHAGLAFEVLCPPLSQPVYLDRDMWEKIVLNLLSNAFKYTFEGGVTVALSERDDYVELSVSDTGTGIPASELPRVFERFHRVAGARGRTQEGTGIGLALVQELARMHGGEVYVESALGRGSTFTVSVPFGQPSSSNGNSPPVSGLASTALRPEAYVQEALRWLPEEDDSLQIPTDFLSEDRAVMPPDRSGFPCPRILLADDNADMRDYLRRLLGSHYQVMAVTNGEEALQEALQSLPDLVLADVMMPHLDGFALLKELRRHPATKAVPVILLSARAGEEAQSEGMEAGADDYLVKPFSARELLARVRSNIAMSRLRRETDRALKRSEELLQQVFAQAPVGICVLRGRELVYELVNAPYEELLPSRPLLGLPLIEAVPEISHSILEILHRVYDTGEPFAADEFLVPLDRDRDGIVEDLWFNFVYHPLREPDGTIWGVVAIAVDVTPHVRARQELQRVNRELEEFAYVASHDLQEPLRTVNIYTELLERELKSHMTPAAEEFAAFVHTGAKRMDQMLKDLLNFSRAVQADEENIAGTRAADLNASLSQALETLQDRVREEAAVITADPLPTVLGDEAQIAQVFQNFISNALKYRKPEESPVIHVAVRQDRNDWTVGVRDNGIGFDQHYAERIFGLFKRLHKDQYPGTGLGLAICKRIIERYGGRVWAESQPGQGSIFYFSLRGVPTP